MAIIQKELTGLEYTLIEPSLETLEMGYVEFRIKVKVEDLFSSFLLPYTQDTCICEEPVGLQVI